MPPRWRTASYILGGGWSLIGSDRRPSAVAMKVDVDWTEVDRLHHWELFLVDEDGQPIIAQTPDGPSRSRSAATSRCRVPSRCPKEARSTSRWRSTSARCRSRRRPDSPGGSRSTARPRRTGSCRSRPAPFAIDDDNPPGGTGHGGARPARSRGLSTRSGAGGRGRGRRGTGSRGARPTIRGRCSSPRRCSPKPRSPASRRAFVSSSRFSPPQPRAPPRPWVTSSERGWGWVTTGAPWRFTRPPRRSWTATGDASGNPRRTRRSPGVGPYTARAVLAFAFDAEVAAVDTNVGRVLARAAAGRPLRPRGAGLGGSPRSGWLGARVESRRDGLRQSRLYGARTRLCHLSGACGRGLCLAEGTRRRSRPGSRLGAGDDPTIPVRRVGPTGARSACAGHVCRTDRAGGPHPGRRLPGAARTRPARRRRARRRGDPRAAARRGADARLTPARARRRVVARSGAPECRA